MLTKSTAGFAARHYNSAQLALALADSRRRLKSLVCDLTDAQWNVPYRAGINPIAWEIAHVAWFAEWWTQRGPHALDAQGRTVAQRPPVHAGPDALLDSSRIAHAQRWSATLPVREQVLAMLDVQLDTSLAALKTCDGTDAGLYFHRLTLFHEDMHNEALAWTRAALHYPAPEGLTLPRAANAQRMQLVKAHSAQVGQMRGGDQPAGFFFDNEKWSQAVEIDAFEIDHLPVSCGAFLRFVVAGGYDKPEYWPHQAGQWRAQSGAAHPVLWRIEQGRWQMRWFDTWLALPEDAPVMHLNAYEAQAYCLWAKRRLPSAAEWEAAARCSAIAWGNSVWEWTASTFTPYAGFSADPYQDYSAPWFHTHRELRGGSFATDARMHHVQYRNYFEAHRNDVFAGFRTCAAA
jgi:gamma-glutamyl hercynylcysteine S-oxide synthase